MEQGSLIPFDSPATVTSTLAQITNRVSRLAPDLDKQDCLVLMGELAILSLLLDRLEPRIVNRVQESARRLGLLA